MKIISHRTIVLLISIMLLTSCSLTGKTNDVIDNPQPIKLTIMHNWIVQDGKALAMRTILEDFRATYPNIIIEEEGLSTDGLKSRLRTLAAADEMPDLFVMWPDAMTKDFVKAGHLQPIDDFLANKPEWKNNFLPGAFDGYTVNNQIYTVPMNLAPTSFIYYNRAIFDQYQVKVPTTWLELLNAIEIFNRNNMIPIALGNKSTWVVQSTIFSTLADRITGSDWFNRVRNQDGASFTDPEFIQALEVLQNLKEVGAFQSGYNSIDENEMMQLYLNGKSAMVINGGWAVSSIVNNATADVLEHTHVMILPPIEGGKGVALSTSGVVGTGLGVNINLTGERKEAAMKLFYALSGPEGQQATLDSNTLISYKISLDESKLSPLFIELNELVQSINISSVYDSSLNSETADVLNNGLQEILLGGDPVIIAQKIQDAQDASLAK